MQAPDDCNAVLGPVLQPDELRATFGQRVRGTGPHHILLPRGQRKLAFTLEGALRPSECAALIAAAERQGFSQAGVGGEVQVVNAQVRSSTRLQSEDFVLARVFWERVRQHVPVAREGRWVLGLNERLRFLRYMPGQHFAPHYDGSFLRKGTENRSCLTLQFYLSDATSTEGGATRFVGGTSLDTGEVFADVDCAPEQGRALIFDHNILHEGAKVKHGTKYTIRTDIEYGPPCISALLASVIGLGGPPSQTRRRATTMIATAVLVVGSLLASRA